jgi:UDP-galactopyranose mutase
MIVPDAFVAGLHVRWDGVRQRPHHLLSRLARHVPVVVVEEPSGAAHDRDDVRREGNVTIVRPLRRRGWSTPLVDDAAIATARAHLPGGRTGAWLYTPMMLELLDAFAAAPIVADVMDDLANFDFAPPGMRAREAELLARADVVFAGGRTLYERRRSASANIYCYPSGVEIERFAVRTGPHPLTAMLRGPVFAYVGVIDERLDYALVAALADAFPDGHVVLAGPVVKVDARRLPQRPNVHYTLHVPYASLPSLLAGVDVGLMPFARNRATASISPTKTLEYFAAGLPVVSTPIADVVSDYDGIAYIAADAPAFVAAARAALDAPAERLARGLERAREQTWDAIFARMWAHITG